MQIEKNVPLIEPKAVLADRMEIGDSVYFEEYKFAMSFRDALRYRGYKYATRKLDKGGWRVWRLL